MISVTIFCHHLHLHLVIQETESFHDHDHFSNWSSWFTLAIILLSIFMNAENKRLVGVVAGFSSTNGSFSLQHIARWFSPPNLILTQSHCILSSRESQKGWEFLSRRSGLQHRRKDRTRFNLAQILLLGFFQGKGPKRRITKVRLGEHTVGGQCWWLLVRNLKIISLTENNFRLPQQSKGRFTSRAGIQYYSGCSFCAWAVQVI